MPKPQLLCSGQLWGPAIPLNQRFLKEFSIREHKVDTTFITKSEERVEPCLFFSINIHNILLKNGDTAAPPPWVW